MHRARSRPALLILSGVAVAMAGCGGSRSSATPAAQRLQREDLIAVAHALASVRAPVGQEVAATKAAWPSVANGLPTAAGGTTVSLIAAAARRSGSLPLPGVMQESRAKSLTGPASSIASLYRSFQIVSGRGWQMLAGSLTEVASGTPAGRRFAIANSPLYVGSVYDAHFGLAQAGRKLLAAYESLGGPGAFGSALTQSEVQALAGTYSEAVLRLHPHPGVKLGS